ncbi:enoyl-CoA hydratase-related protein [Caballeronia sp. LZ062]|uniref:enoyl-CoA hydratase/isomerase family protein n=1 Tax=unclassified Caballeronia TaxID=2646786 RepID=UPI0028612597|nr:MULTISPECIES: enoyl-CoA hydratase-related protein [unclassified Caballeronia]MDR5856022.1 enoyl-CoA hydratase-related protein [Caballeronia sp. LZ050]MDR5872692.1 enoyl-CoA hydratase-related protein [Caballeronia sp. LZ062]
MAEPSIVTEREGDIATVIIDRPDKLNAMTKQLWQSLGQTIETLSAEDALRCIVLRGAGEKAFSPGNDIGEFRTDRSNVEQARAYGAIMHRTLAALKNCRHPLIAMIHGICVGGGLEIAAMCDLRICGESSRFGVPIKNLGLVMAHAEMEGLVQLVGPAVALEILLEGQVFDANEALAKGLVTRIVPDSEVTPHTYETARRIADGAPLVARWHKKFIRRVMDPTPLADDERDEGFACFGTVDFRTGYEAFLSKIKPEFKGR